MDLSAVSMMKVLGPKVPLLLKTSAMHTIGLSTGAYVWDLRTELLITILRSFTDGTAHPTPISKQQRMSIKAPPVPGYLWVSRTQSQAPPEDDAQQLLFKTVEELGFFRPSYEKPAMVNVEAEWQGQRRDSEATSPEPSISEGEKYQNLLHEAESDTVIMYLHGGAMYLMDPATHRIPVSSRLLKRTKGRIYSVRYRLAPQHAFPAALLDAFQSYLSLLSPPPGAPHEPIPASKIVLSGDSAGGNLCMSLLQLLLRTNGQTIKFHGKDTRIELPAGLALSSPWMDVARALPSLESNAKFDYLPPPSKTHLAHFPPCNAWPTAPPRRELYCDAEAMSHPLISPIAAVDWTGAPPIYMIFGEEMLEDECRFTASRLASQGVVVVADVYQAMPHCFPMLLDKHPAQSGAFDSWANFVTTCVTKPESLVTKGTYITAKKLERKNLEVAGMARQSREEVIEMMQEAIAKRIEDKESEVRALPAAKL